MTQTWPYRDGGAVQHDEDGHVQHPAEPEPLEGWLFLRSDAVPEKWRERAVPVSFVPMLPGEMEEVAGNGPAEFVPSDEDIALYKLVARGLPAPQIGKELGIATRSVHRRLARLRERLGVRSTAQIAAEFSKRGF